MRFLHIPEKVFKAVVDTHVLIFEKTSLTSKERKKNIFNVDNLQKYLPVCSHSLRQGDMPEDGSPVNIVASEQKQKLFHKIESFSMDI